MKKLAIFGSVAAIMALFGAGVAHAQEDANVSANANISAEVSDRPAQGQDRQPTERRGDGERRSDAAVTAQEEAKVNTEADATETPESDHSTTTRPQEDQRTLIKNEIEQRKRDLEQRREENASSTEEARRARIAERFDQIVKNAGERLGAEVDRLTEIKAKIDSRLLKLEQAGATTTEARADEGLAVTAINDAQVQVDALSMIQLSATSTSAADIKASIDTIRQAIRDAQKAINEAQQALMKVVADMKGLQASVEASAQVEATSSSEGNN